MCVVDFITLNSPTKKEGVGRGALLLLLDGIGTVLFLMSKTVVFMVFFHRLWKWIDKTAVSINFWRIGGSGACGWWEMDGFRLLVRVPKVF